MGLLPFLECYCMSATVQKHIKESWQYPQQYKSTGSKAPAYRCSTIADAPPPPLQIAATPALPLCRSMTFSSLTMMATPEAPMGCPRATAPPCTFTLHTHSRQLRSTTLTLRLRQRRRMTGSLLHSTYVAQNTGMHEVRFEICLASLRVSSGCLTISTAENACLTNVDRC